MPQETEYKKYRWEKFKELLFGHKLTYEEMQNLKNSPGFDPDRQMVYREQYRSSFSSFPIGWWLTLPFPSATISTEWEGIFMTTVKSDQIWNDTYVYPSERTATVISVDEDSNRVECRENTGFQRTFTMNLQGFLKRYERVS